MHAPFFFSMICLLGVAAAMAPLEPAYAQRTGVTTTEVFKNAVTDTENLEVTVLDVKYLPEGINRRHFHPAALTFYIVSGTAVFQEEGKAPVTLASYSTLMFACRITRPQRSFS